MSHRLPDGVRRNVKQKMKEEGISQRDAVRQIAPQAIRISTERQVDGTMRAAPYIPPELANPGNVIDCGGSGGGYLSSDIAHENEAPFPEDLISPFVLSFCPKGGVVLDPFAGSGTTISVARQYRRRWIGVDIRESQIELCQKRLGEARMRQGFDLY